MSETLQTTNKEIMIPTQHSSVIGLPSRSAEKYLLTQLATSLELSSVGEADYSVAIAEMMIAIAPTDPIEAMMVTQMLATHNAVMLCNKRIAELEDQSGRVWDALTQNATKLMQLFLNQQKALDKRRGKADQKVLIQHVNVNSGGQAIVGSVNHHGEQKNGLAAQA